MSKRKPRKISVDKKLFQSGTNKVAILSELKNNTYQEFKKQIKVAYRHPISKALIQGKAKPKSYTDLREYRNPLYSNNLEGELAWVIESIRSSTTDINKFLAYQNKIEKSIIFGKHEETLHLLNEMENKICCSYWGLELRYFLIEQTHGTEENWKLAHEINSSTSNSYTLFFNQIFSKKAEKGVSCSDFHRSIQNELKFAGQYDYEYLNYKLSYYLLPNYELYSFLIFGDSASSIIDRYNATIGLLVELLSSDKEENILLAKKALMDLKQVDDHRIKRLMEYCGMCKTEIMSLDYIQVLESYTRGEYGYCLEKIPFLLKKDPNLIELWEIYVKSLLEESDEFVETKISKQLDDFLNKLFISFRIEDQSNQRTDELLKLIISLPNLSFSKQLLSLINSNLGIYSTKNVISKNICFYSLYPNPISAFHSSSIDGTAEFQNLITTESLRYMAGFDVNEQKLKASLGIFKYNLYRLRRYFKKQDFEKVILIGEQLKLNEQNNNTFIEEIISSMFHSYFRVENYDDAIKLYVDAFFKNKHLVSKINTSDLTKKIIELGYPIAGGIDSAIFFHLGNLDYYQCFVVIEMWLQSAGLSKPSEIQLPSDELELRKTLFILEYGCIPEVLEKFYYDYDTKEDVINQRKGVLSILIRSKADNKNYINELTSITQKEKVQSILEEVNSGRVRLTLDMMESLDEKSLQNSYQRYRLLTEFTENFDFDSYDSKTLLNNFLESLVDSKQLSSNPSYLSFKSLVNELIEGFLFNKKNGLDGELSTRIRHGELENQIRSVFDKFHLISKKDDDGNYTNIQHWEFYEVKLENEAKSIAIQNSLKEFSGRIDAIIKILVDENIQVISQNYPEKTNAFFNYYFSEEFFKIMYEESKLTNGTYEEFTEYVFSVLKKVTENSLQKIIEYLKSTLSKIIDNELDQLKMKIDSISTDLVEINQNIVDAKVGFQNEILQISKWFLIANSVIETAMDVKTIIECSFESSNIQHPNAPIEPKIKGQVDLLINNYEHFIFIVLNLIENIRVHSKLSVEELGVEVNVEYNKDDLIFSIKNNFDAKLINKENLESTFKTIKNKWKDDVDQEYVNREKGSGYQKIKKLLVYDIKSRRNSFDYKIEENSLEVILGVEILMQYKIDG